jgi:hypothetical protein
MSAIDVVSRLIDIHPDVASIKFIEYSLIPTFNQFARRTRVSFEQSLERRLQHGGKEIKTYGLSREVISPRHLRQLISDLPKKGALAVSSRVVLNNHEEAHIPLVDFQCMQSKRNLIHLTLAMRRINHMGGVILNSGNSYHYYGISLLTDTEWRQYIGRCLLLEPLVDVRYLGHCLLENEAAIRISPHQHSGKYPTVVAVV